MDKVVAVALVGLLLLLGAAVVMNVYYVRADYEFDSDG